MEGKGGKPDSWLWMEAAGVLELELTTRAPGGGVWRGTRIVSKRLRCEELESTLETQGG